MVVGAWRLPRLDEVADWLVGRLRPGDLCLTLGAGDLTSVPDMVIERLEARPHRPQPEPPKTGR